MKLRSLVHDYGKVCSLGEKSCYCGAMPVGTAILKRQNDDMIEVVVDISSTIEGAHMPVLHCTKKGDKYRVFMVSLISVIPDPAAAVKFTGSQLELISS